MIDDTNKTETEEVVDAGESAEAVTNDAAPVSLSVNDLSNLRQIIDVASSRGAFKANEMQVVGITYDRLNAFLSAVAASAQVEGEATDEATEETAEA